ncbi:hypothetical protein BX600DRAFT_495656 [Xylariales sp. PMI_506]|nr:hypothetical protein BX600DRAFT_495656 [Xylariales sp. PMI_506]
MHFRRLLAAVRSRPSTVSQVQYSLSPLFRKSRIFRNSHSQGTTRDEAPTSRKRSDPLRILFCGSDEFSSASLLALYAEHEKNPGLIESIDVVIRPGKPTGRGYKKILHPPIRDVAIKLGLPIHERDTFTGWNMPPSTNLIIAVSFGLFVPPRLLRTAKYGGLNLHPSLLPDFRGPAPLHHILLAGDDATPGITLQTLDERAFDRGVILAQTGSFSSSSSSSSLLRSSDPETTAAATTTTTTTTVTSPPEEDILLPPTCTVPQLQAIVSPIAARLLVQGLRDGVHVPPLRAVVAAAAPGASLRHAPKITPRMRQLFPAVAPPDQDQQPWSAAETERRQRVIGPLWFQAADKTGASLKRVIVDEGAVSVVEGYTGLWAPEGYQVSEAERLRWGDAPPVRNAAAAAYGISAEGGGNKQQQQQHSRDPKQPVMRFYCFTLHGTTSTGSAPPHVTDTPYQLPVVYWFSDRDNCMYIAEKLDWVEETAEDSASSSPVKRVRVLRALKIDRLKVEGKKSMSARLAFGQLAYEPIQFDDLKNETAAAGKCSSLDPHTYVDILEFKCRSS